MQFLFRFSKFFLKSGNLDYSHLINLHLGHVFFNRSNLLKVDVVDKLLSSDTILPLHKTFFRRSRGQGVGVATGGAGVTTGVAGVTTAYVVVATG